MAPRGHWQTMCPRRLVVCASSLHAATLAVTAIVLPPIRSSCAAGRSFHVELFSSQGGRVLTYREPGRLC